MRYPFVYSNLQIEDENDEDRGRLVLVIFDFEIKENMSRVTNTFRPYDDYKGENSIQEMPWLDIEVSNCNCSRYPDLRGHSKNFKRDAFRVTIGKIIH